MSDNVKVNVDPGNSFPNGAELIIPRRKFRDDKKKIYFMNKTLCKNNVLIPEDTLIILNKTITDDTTVVSATAIKGTWSIKHGTHKGTAQSQDFSWKQGFKSLEEAKEQYAIDRDNAKSQGLYCWFAYAYPPNTKKIKDRIKIGIPE
jgi:hypothetical protein